MKISNDNLLDIITEASYRLHSEIRRSFRTDKLEQYLESIGMQDLLPYEEEQPLYDTNPDGKILIFGAPQVKEKEIFGLLKEFGISKERIELHLGYEEVKSYSFRFLQYNPNCRLILFGPVPHSGAGKEDSSSIITNLEQQDGYPKVVRLTDGHGLKLTKTSIKRAIEQEIQSGYLAVC